MKASRLRSIIVFAVPLLAFASFVVRAPAQAILYVTDGDASKLQAIDTSTGTVLYSATTSIHAYPIAVRDTIALGQRENSGLSGEYNLADGSLIGTSGTPTGIPWDQSVDGAVNGSHNYTFAAFFGPSTTVYQTDADWTNPVALFTVNGSPLVGITYDSASDHLWISGSSQIAEYTLAGSVVSQFAVANSYGALAYQAGTDTLWFVPNNSSAALQEYSKSGVLLQSVAVNDRSGNIFGAEFQVVPEPTTSVLLATGVVLLGLSRLRRRPA